MLCSYELEDAGALVGVGRRVTVLANEYWQICIDLHGAIQSRQIGLAYSSARRCLTHAIDATLIVRERTPFVSAGTRMEQAASCLGESTARHAEALFQASPTSWEEVELFASSVLEFIENELDFSPHAIALGESAEDFWRLRARNLRTEHTQEFMGALGVAGELAARFGINPTDRPVGGWVHYLQEDREEADYAARRRLGG